MSDMPDDQVNDWLVVAGNRLGRLKRLLELKAPAMVVSGEAALLRQAVDMVDGARGDRTAYEAARKEAPDHA